MRTILLHTASKVELPKRLRYTFKKLVKQPNLKGHFQDLLNQQAVLQPIQKLNAAVQLPYLQAQWETLSFQGRAKLGGVLFRSFGQTMRRILRADLHEVELEEGSISYWKTNRKRKETIVFFHGFGDSSESAYLLALNLAHRYDLIVPDIPGFGKSFKRKDLPHDYENYTRWLVHFLEKTCPGPVHVVGNSLGGAFAMMVAKSRPDLVKSMTLLNSAAITDFEQTSVYDEFLRGDILFQVRDLKDFDRFLDRVFHKKPYSPPGFREYLCKLFQENYEWYGQIVRGIFGHIKSTDDPRYAGIFMNHHIPDIEVPSLVIWGDQDTLFPVSFAERAHELLKNSRLVILKNVGHAPHLEVPHKVARHLRDFIRLTEN